MLGVTASTEALSGSVQHGRAGEAAISNSKAQVDSSLYGRTPTLLWLLPPGQTRGVYRLVTAEVMNWLPINDGYRFRFSPEAFDLWCSCIAFEHSHNVAKRVYRLEPYDEQHIHREYDTPTTTVADLFEVYY